MLVHYLLDDGKFYYRTTTNLYKTGCLSSSKSIYYFEQVYLLAFSIRVMLALVPQSPFIGFDPVMLYFYTNQYFNDYCFVTAVLMLTLFCVHLRHCNCSLPPNNIYRNAFYSIVIRNVDIYRKCAKSKSHIDDLRKRKFKKTYLKFKNEHYLLNVILPDWLVQFVCFGVAKLGITLKFEDTDKVKLARHSLELYPNLSIEIRSKVALLQIAFDQFSAGFFVLVYVIVTVILTSMSVSICQPFDIWFVPLIVLDLMLLEHSIVLLVQVALLANYDTLMYKIVFTSHIGQLNQALKSLVCLHKKARRFIDYESIFLLKRFLQEHVRFSYYLIRANELFSSKALFGTVIFNIPGHIGLVGRLVFQPLSPVDLAINWIFLFGQSVLLVLILSQQSFYNQFLHYSRDHIPTVQLLMRDNMMRFKVKYMALHERLTTGTKYGTKIGPGPAVTNKIVLELLLIYIGYLLNVFGLIIKKKI